MQTEVIKIRVSAAEKRKFVDAAIADETDVSSMLRRAGRALLGGRVASNALLKDLAALRRIANRLSAAAEARDPDLGVLKSIARTAAKEVNDVAARHLATIR